MLRYRVLLALALVALASCSELGSSQTSSMPDEVQPNAVLPTGTLGLHLAPEGAKYAPGDQVVLELEATGEIDLEASVTKGVWSVLDVRNGDLWEANHILVGQTNSSEAASWPVGDSGRGYPDIALPGDSPEMIEIPDVPAGLYRIVKEISVLVDGDWRTVALGVEITVEG